MKTVIRCMTAALGLACLGLAGGEPAGGRLQLAEEVVVASPIIDGDEVTPWGGLVTSVSEAQIDQLNAYDLSAALRRTPGVTVTRYNRVGSFGGGAGGAVFVRGMGSSRPGGDIVVLLDGVAMSNGVWNHPLLDLATIGPATRVDVYKGPQPMFFGNAFSAVNIVPKSWTEDDPHARLSLSYGSDSTWHQSVEGGGASGPFDFFVGQSTASSNGHREESDGREGEVHAQFGWQLDDHWRLNAFFLASESATDDPGPEGRPDEREGSYETSQWMTTVSLSHQYENVNGSAKLYANRGNGDWQDEPGTVKDNLNDWFCYGIRLRENVRPWEGGELALGLDQDVTEAKSKFVHTDGTLVYLDRETLRLLSPFAGLSQMVGDREGWWLQPSAGLRYYNHNALGEAYAPQAGLNFGHGQVEGHLAYTRGVHYPGIELLVLPVSSGFLSQLTDAWGDLDPETLDHFEAGVSVPVGEAARIGLTVFYDEGKNRYNFYHETGTPGYMPNAWDTIETFRQRGAELTATVHPHKNVSLFGGVTYLDPDPSDLPYCPEWMVVGGATWRFHAAFELSADVQWVDKMHVGAQVRKLDTANADTVGAHLLVNAKLAYHFQVGEKLQGKVFVALENMLDDDYEYLPDYPMPGFSAMTGLEVSF